MDRRSFLTAAGAAGLFSAIGLPAAAVSAAPLPMHIRVTAYLADWTAEGNPARTQDEIEPKMFAYLTAAGLLDHMNWQYIYPDSPTTYWMRREAIQRGQIALAYRISQHAGDMMQDFMDIQPKRPARWARVNSDPIKHRAIGRTRERVYLGPATGGALPRTVLDRVQVEALDWRYRDLMKAHLRPVANGATMMALERTPLGQTHYEMMTQERA